jgi:hypothetical protein
MEINVLVFTPVTSVGPDWELGYDYDLQSIDNCEDEKHTRYRCIECGWVLENPDDTGSMDLFAVLTHPDSPCKPKGPPSGSDA